MSRPTWTRLARLAGLALLAVPWQSSLAGNPVTFLPGTTPPIDTSELFGNASWAEPPMVSPNGIDNLYFAKPDPNKAGANLVDTDATKPVRIYSKRSATDLYLGVTFPTPAFPFKAASPILQNPHKVQIFIATRPDAMTPETCYRLDYETFRVIDTVTNKAIVNDPNFPDQAGWTQFKLPNAVATGPVVWNPPQAPPQFNTPAGAPEQALTVAGVFDVRRVEHSSGDGFDLKVKIPLAAIFKPTVPAKLPPIRFALGLVNELGVTYDTIDGNPNDAMTIPYSIPHYPTGLGVEPEAANPQITSRPDPSILPDWSDTNKWAEALLETPALPSITFDRSTVTWLTGNAIRVAFQSATLNGQPIVTNNWFLLGNGPIYNPSYPGWYTYDSNKPCNIRVFTRIQNTGGPIDGNNPPMVRVLMVWGKHGAFPAQWTTMNLTNPFPVVLNDGGNGMILPPFDWPCLNLQGNWINGALSEHPCVATYVLPANLNVQGLDAAAIAGLTKVSDAFITDLRNKYLVSDSQCAQMNINVVGTAAGVVCEVCPKPKVINIPIQPGIPIHERGPETPKFNLRAVPGPALNASAARPPLSLVSRVVPQVPDAAPSPPVFVLEETVDPTRPRPPAPMRDLKVDFSAWGTREQDKNPKRRSFVLIQSLGGVQEYIRREYLDAHEEIPVKFEVANKEDHPRIITVSGVLTPPDDLKNFQLTFDQPKGVFRAGEVRTVTGLVRKVKGGGTTQAPPPTPGKTPPTPGKTPPVPSKTPPTPGKGTPQSGYSMSLIETPSVAANILEATSASVP